jgi:hypothetical protein
MERIDGYKEVYHSRDKVYADIKRNINLAIAANDNKIHVINGQTAIGKTQIILDIMRDSNLRIFYASPTNILKDDFYERADSERIDVTKTPSLHDKELKPQIPTKIRQHIDFLFDTGQHSLVNQYIKEVAHTDGIDCLKEYWEQIKSVARADTHVITTHRKLFIVN